MKANPKFIAWLAAAFLLVALGTAVLFWAFRQAEEAAEIRKHSRAVLNSADDILSALKDAETSMRGFLLTGDDAFLEPYLVVRDSISGDLRKLRQLTLSPAAAEHLDALAPIVDSFAIRCRLMLVRSYLSGSEI